MARGFRLEWTRFTFAVNSFSGSSSAVVGSNCYQLSLNFCHLLKSQVKFAIYLSVNLFVALIFVIYWILVDKISFWKHSYIAILSD